MLSHVHDTIGICCRKDDIGNYNLPSHMMAPKTTPKTTVSQNLISRWNMLSPITFFGLIKSQPKQRLQLQFHKIQCPYHFFMESTCHPIQNTMYTSFFL